MNDEHYTPALGSWLKDSDVPPPDPQISAHRIMAQLPELEEPRRRWPFHRRTAPANTAIIPTVEYQPSPIPASNGHTPTVIGRTQSMFSPVKAITAGALVFAIGGALLIAQPFDQQIGVPGAATEVPAPVAFTAKYAWSHQPATGETETLPNGVERTSEATWLFRSVSASDQRFEGVSTLTSTWDTYPEAEAAIGAHVVRYENGDGAWQEAPYSRVWWTDARDTPGDEEMVTGESVQRTLHGEGDYEGLVALIVETWNGNGWDVEGFIFDGDLPPAPEAWTDVSDSQ